MKVLEKVLDFSDTSQLIAAIGAPVLIIAKIAAEPGWQAKLQGIVNGFLTNPSNEAVVTKHPGAEAVAVLVGGLLTLVYIIIRQKK